MATTVISESVDIYQLPDTRKDADATTEVTLGDLHANVIKLVFSLAREGICKISQHDYQQLVNIYIEWDTFSGEKLIDAMLRFKTIITQLNILNRSILIRLLGDELADRGCCDWLVLIVLDKLRLERVPMTIILSNHTSEFIEAVEYYEERHRLSIANPKGTMTDFLYGSSISPEHGVTHSLKHLSSLIQRHLIDINEVNELFNTCYRHNLCLLDIDHSIEDKKWFLFSHAPIGLKAIFSLAACMNIAYQGLSLQDIVYKINLYFQGHYLHSNNKLSDLYLNAHPALIDAVLYILWNRDGDQHRLLRQKVYEERDLIWVHGHDHGSQLTDSVNPHVVNLDNILGKHLNLNQGEYKIVIKQTLDHNLD